jgi:hypothetical protein
MTAAGFRATATRRQRGRVEYGDIWPFDRARFGYGGCRLGGVDTVERVRRCMRIDEFIWVREAAWATGRHLLGSSSGIGVARRGSPARACAYVWMYVCTWKLGEASHCRRTARSRRACRRTDGQTGRRADGQTSRRADWKTDRRTGRQTEQTDIEERNF